MNLTTNIQHYPEWTAYLKDWQPKTLIMWGRNDPLILPAAAEFVKQLCRRLTCVISTPATSRSTRTPRRSSRRSPDRTDARLSKNGRAFLNNLKEGEEWKGTRLKTKAGKGCWLAVAFNNPDPRVT